MTLLEAAKLVLTITRRCAVCDRMAPWWDGHDRNPPCVGRARELLADAVAGEWTHRYHVFAGNDYYPQGGMGDYIGSFASMDGARASVLGERASGYRPADWWHVGHWEQDVWVLDESTDL